MAITWQEVTVPTVGNTSDQLRDFCAMGASGFCAVGDAGLVYTSPDGLVWTKRTAAAASLWRGVAFNGSRLVAVSANGTVMTSDNLGVLWTTRTASEANAWQSVCWADALGLFVAVASNGTHRVMTSADGTTWANQTAAAALAWIGVCWSDNLGLFCAVAVSGGNIIMTSLDGSAWTQETTPAGVIQSGTASGSSVIQWSAAAGMFAFVSRVSARSVTTSPDGSVWTEQTIPDSGQANGGVVATDGDFVLFRQGGTNRVDTSDDGVTWTAVDPGFYRLWDCAGWSLTLNRVVSWDNGGHDTMLVGDLEPAPPPPVVVVTVTPDAGPVAGGTVVTITSTGGGLNGTTAVTFGGLAAAFTIISDTKLTAVSPSHAAGPITITVSGPDIEAPFTYQLTKQLLPPVPRLR